MLKALPPYGKHLSNAIMAGEAHTAIIFMGDHAKTRCEAFQEHLPYTCYLPTSTHPKRYQWPVMGLSVYLIDTSYSHPNFIKTCVLCLLKYGATQIHYFSPKYNQVFKRELKNV